MDEKYKKLGASADKAGLHGALSKAGIAAPEHLFAQVIPDLAGDGNYYSFLHCDGAGTKSIIAFLMYRETGDPECFAGLAQDALVMNLDDVFCIGRPSSLALANLIARNLKLIDDHVLEQIFARYRQLSERLAQLGVPIELCGGETADCGDIVRTLVVDAVLTGRIEKARVIRNDRIGPGDVIVGFSSTGQTTYEEEENSAIAANGMSLARHALLSQNKIEDLVHILDPELNLRNAYTGPYAITDEPPELGMSIGKALLSPTRTYAPVLARIYEDLEESGCGDAIHGAIHCTGGGQTKVLRFGKGLHFIKNNLFDLPPLFALIQQHGEVSWHEMYKVFNMGHRFELYVKESVVDRIIAIARDFQLEAKEVGYVKPGMKTTSSNNLTIESNYGIFEYSL